MEGLREEGPGKERSGIWGRHPEELRRERRPSRGGHKTKGRTAADSKEKQRFAGLVLAERL